MSLLDNRGMTSAAERLLDSAKRNPEGVLLLAAGAALLLRRTGVVGSMRSSRSNGHYRSNGQQQGRTGQSSENGMAEQAHGLADTARSYASDVAGRVTRSAEGMADYTTGMARAAVDRSSRLAHDTGSTMRGAMDRMLDEQPLTLALFGLAAGAILASALPATGMERNALGPVGKKLSDAAEEAGERLKKSAARAGERLSEMADERGLNARGLREGAREVAQSFSEGMTADDQQRQPSGQTRGAGQQSGQTTSGQQQAAAGSRPLDPMDPANRMRSGTASSGTSEDRTRQGTSGNPPASGRMS